MFSIVERTFEGVVTRIEPNSILVASCEDQSSSAGAGGEAGSGATSCESEWTLSVSEPDLTTIVLRVGARVRVEFRAQWAFGVGANLFVTDLTQAEAPIVLIASSWGSLPADGPLSVDWFDLDCIPTSQAPLAKAFALDFTPRGASAAVRVNMGETKPLAFEPAGEERWDAHNVRSYLNGYPDEFFATQFYVALRR